MSNSPLLDPSVCALVLVTPNAPDRASIDFQTDAICRRSIAAVITASEAAHVPVFVLSRAAQEQNRSTLLPVPSTPSQRRFVFEEHVSPWSHKPFVEALTAEDRSILILAGFWLELEVLATALHALVDGYDVYGFLTKCLDCIRRTAEQHRIERARIAQAAERRGQHDLVPAAQPIDLANLRPVGQRLPPELFEAAKRFVFDFRDGHTEHIAGEMEPELYALLEWLAQQSMLEVEQRRKPEEVGREILGYRDANTSRGVAYGALWAALVRAVAVYSRADSKTIDGTQTDPLQPGPGKQRRRG